MKIGQKIDSYTGDPLHVITLLQYNKNEEELVISNNI